MRYTTELKETTWRTWANIFNLWRTDTQMCDLGRWVSLSV